jgi:hypothetical protein
LKVYEKLERGRGWEQKTFPSYQGARYYASMPNVGFVRFKRTEYDVLPELGVGAAVDVTYIGGATLPESSYTSSKADLTRPIKYFVEGDLLNPTPTQARTSRTTTSIVDAFNRKVLITQTQFQFRFRTIPVWHWFGPSGTVGCPLPEDGQYRRNGFFDQSMFKD